MAAVLSEAPSYLVARAVRFETGITITDSAFFSFAIEQFAPGLQLHLPSGPNSQ